MITDRYQDRSKKLIILPYLHEKRIYLNRLKKKVEYFYTSVETTVQDQIKHNNLLKEVYGVNTDKVFE